MAEDKIKHDHSSSSTRECCGQEEKINIQARKLGVDEDEEGHSHDHDHSEESGKMSLAKTYGPAAISFVMLVLGIVFDNYFKAGFFKGYLRLAWYIIAYIPVGLPVVIDALKAIWQREFFTEFFLMSIATIGAMSIGEYPEGVAVMLFYTIGELFQSAAVNRAKRSIKALLDIRPSIATI